MIIVWRRPPKSHVHNLVTYLDQACIFEGYAIRCGSKNDTKRYVLKRDWTPIELRAQNIITILTSTVITFEGSTYTTTR